MESNEIQDTKSGDNAVGVRYGVKSREEEKCCRLGEWRKGIQEDHEPFQHEKKKNLVL